TSASTRKVAVSDHTSAEIEIVLPVRSKLVVSIFVNGQGPAMHDARALRNSFPAPASSNVLPLAAFHLPSGEHGGWPLHGTLPTFETSKERTALPTVATVPLLIEYRTVRLPMVCLGAVLSTGFTGLIDTSLATVMSPPGFA